MKWAYSSILALAISGAAGAAYADDGEALLATAPPRENVASVPLLALSPSSFALQAERYLDRRFSIAASAAVDRAAGGDYQSLGIGLGVEGRYWFKRRASGSGPFGAARLDVNRTSVSTAGASIGSAWSFAESALCGWRWIVSERVEITPAVGLVVHTELATGLAASTRATGTVGITAGWLF